MSYPTSATKNFDAQPRFRGGVAARTLTGAVTCDAATEVYCYWDPGGASRDVTLPAEETSSGLVFHFYNEADADEDLVIKSDGASTIATINRAGWAVVSCDGTTWRAANVSGIETIVAATATAIPVTRSGSFPITTAAAETNTLAAPSFLGQTMSLFVDTYAVGARVVTASARINQAANTVMTFGAVGDFIKLEAITIAGALRWQVVANDGVALS